MRCLRLIALLVLGLAAVSSSLAVVIAPAGSHVAEAGDCPGDDCNDCRNCDACPPGCRAPVAALPGLVEPAPASGFVAVVAAKREATVTLAGPVADIFHPPRLA